MDIDGQLFHKFLYLLNRVIRTPTEPASFKSHDCIRRLDTVDRQLVAQWVEDIGINRRPAERLAFEAKMYSARLAEKGAASFYKSLGYQVEDISITQVTSPNGGDWLNQDLSIAGQWPVDVKNSRPTQNSRFSC